MKKATHLLNLHSGRSASGRHCRPQEVQVKRMRMQNLWWPRASSLMTAPSSQMLAYLLSAGAAHHAMASRCLKLHQRQMCTPAYALHMPITPPAIEAWLDLSRLAEQSTSRLHVA